MKHRRVFRRSNKSKRAEDIRSQKRDLMAGRASDETSKSRDL